MATDQITRSQRERIVVFTLSLLLGAMTFFYLLLIGGAASLAMMLAVLAGAIFLGLHYLFWGHRAMQDRSDSSEPGD